MTAENQLLLDRNLAVEFDDGWFEPNVLPPVARWMGQRAAVKFRGLKISEIRLDLTTHLPDLGERPLGVELFLNGERICGFSLWRYGWLELHVPVSEDLSELAKGEFKMELRTDRTWQPRPVAGETRDDRELSIAVCNIVVR